MPLFSKPLAQGDLKPGDQISRRGNGSAAVACHRGIVVTNRKTSVAPATLSIVPMEQRENDFYIIHDEESGHDQVENLGLRLQATGASVWRDMEAQNLTAAGMERSLRNSRAALLFMSDGVMVSQYCNSELR